MAITEREKHIENLKTLVAFLEVNPIFKLSDEMYKSLDYAISSLKTDLKYDLIYEGEEVYTKADMVAMLTDIQLEIEEKATDICDDGWWLTYNDIIQQKIDALKKVVNDGSDTNS